MEELEELIGKNLGEYCIKEKIGGGGMAVVFKAYQACLDRYVALKVMKPSLAKDPDFRERFKREAKSIARLDHPHILPVIDSGEDKGYSYIAMRYVEGEQTLGQVMRRPLRPERAVHLISQVAKALAYAHSRGVIHRDVKPNNVLLDGDWVLLSDFGLAKAVGDTSMTADGKAIGTPLYMSPEQFRGAKVDRRTDIYSLGVILFEMLTGVIPHKANDATAMGVKRNCEPPPSPRDLNPHISEKLEKVVLCALQINPEDRYESAKDFLEALQRARMDDFKREPLGSSPGEQIGPAVYRRPSRTETLESILSNTLLVLRIVLNPRKHALTKREDLRKLNLSLGDKINIAAMFATIVGIVVTGIATIITVIGIPNLGALPASPTPTPTVVAVDPTPTHTPTLALTPVPTNALAAPTDTPPFPTSTPGYASTATSSVANTPTPSETRANTPTATPAPPTPTATITPSPVTRVPTVTLPPPLIIPSGTFTLTKPLDYETIVGPTTFEWQWSGDLPPGFGFEVRIWRDGEVPTGVHDAVKDYQNGNVIAVGDNTYRLVANIRDAPAVRGLPGEYLWTVLLVRISPDYDGNLGIQATPGHLRFEAGDGGGKSGGTVIR